MTESCDIVAILLAAGRSERFGPADKLMAPLGGKPLAQHAAERIAALGTARRIAVCANGTGPLAEIFRARGFEIVVNDRPERGLSASLRLAVAAASAGREKAALLGLADMPFVSASHFAALLARFDPVHTPVLASSRDGQPMPPAIFDRSMFAALGALEGDKGAREMLRHAELVAAAPDELIDIDRPGDLPGSLA